MGDRTVKGVIGPEGYCPVCRFIVSLNDEGLLGVHYRLASSVAKYRCDGSLRRPAKRTPVTSRKSGFTTTLKPPPAGAGN